MQGTDAVALVDHGDVAEVVAGAEPAALLAVHLDDRLAALDHEEARDALALGHGHFAGREAVLLEGAAQALELTRLQLREERDTLQQLY